MIRQGYYPLDPRVRRQVDALLGAGYEVDVICKRRADEAALQREGPLVVHRVRIASRRAGHLNYLAQYGAFFVFAAVLTAILHLRRRFDLVQVCTVPDSLVFAAIVPKLFGARVILDLHECMPEFYAVKFGAGMQHPVVRLIAWIEQAAIRFADLALTCTDQMRDAFVSRGAPADKVLVIVNSADESEFDPRRYPASPPSNGEFTVICHGTVERVYGIDTIVRAVSLLRDELPGLRLQIYGEGSALPEIRSLVSELELGDRVSVSGQFIPMDDLVKAIASADAGVVAMRRDLHRDLTLCNKMFDYIAMRKPAVVSRTHSVEAYFDDACFEMFDGGDPYDLARAIRELHSDPSLRIRLAERAAAANEPFRWPHQRKHYQDIVDRLIGKEAVGPDDGAARSMNRDLPLLAVAWDNHQARTQALADALGGRALYLRSRPQHKLALPIRYLVDGVRMWRLLGRHRPRALLVITPPVIPPVVALAWSLAHPCTVIVDCHTGAFHSWRWRWSMPLLRLACRHAKATLVHTTADEEIVRAWGVTPMLVPDDVPEMTQAEPLRPSPSPRVVVAGSLDGNEPVAAALAAARLLPDFEVRFTGDEHRVAAEIRRAAPANVVFTGWLDYRRFLGELLAAHVVAVFSTDPFIMNRAAFEGVGLARPLVLSDLPLLRVRFGEAAVFSTNHPSDMADAIRSAFHQQDELASRSTRLQGRLRAEHERALEQLRTVIEGGVRSIAQPVLEVAETQ